MELCHSGDGSARTEVDSGGSVTKTLANVGRSFKGAEAELVLNPLRLAFETKNPKVIELALDCIHVCYLLFNSCSSKNITNSFCLTVLFQKVTLFTSCESLCL
jgi:hypothetical protein